MITIVITTSSTIDKKNLKSYFTDKKLFRVSQNLYYLSVDFVFNSSQTWWNSQTLLLLDPENIWSVFFTMNRCVWCQYIVFFEILWLKSTKCKYKLHSDLKTNIKADCEMLSRKWLHHTVFYVFCYRKHLISPLSMPFHEIFYYDDMHHVKQVNMSHGSYV